MPWVSWVGAALAFVVVSHVVSDHDIFYFVIPRVNLERQALYGLFAFLLLLPAVFGPQDSSLIRRLLRSWPMASLGVISYGIYLWHLNLIDKSVQWVGWHTGTIPYWQLALTVLALSIAFASASYFGLERPILLLKGRISWWDRQPSPAGKAARPGPEPTGSPDSIENAERGRTRSAPKPPDERP
jgi:peptidoglycan/LPS O-acetylase OafA/YrhL